MTEYPFIIDDAFKTGLRPEVTYLDAEGFLSDCLNMQPGEGGLISNELITDPYSSAQAVAFPFPQIFRGSELTLMLSATTLSEIGTGSLPWTITGVTTYNFASPAATLGITSGGQWHFVDLGPAFYAFNGNCTVFRTGLDSLETSATSKTYVQSAVTIKTGCTHKGRVYVGGFNPANIWSSDWTEIFTQWEDEAALDEIDLKTNGPGLNWVMWSSIGGGDIPLWLFYPVGYSQLGIGPTKESVIERLKRNELGWSPMPFDGTVQVMKPLGENVIVYGDEGVAALASRGSRIGIVPIADFGIQGRGAVGGDLKSHVFMAENGDLWKLTPDLSLTKLGYKEWFSSFSAASTLITFNPIEKEFTISDSGDAAYVLTESGLGERYNAITSEVYLSGTRYGLATTLTTTQIQVTTGAFDNNRQAIKMIHDVQVQYQDITNMTVAVLYRYNSNSAFATWGPVSVNPEGVVTCTVSGLEFKIQIKGTPGTNPRIDRVEVRWNLVDKRAVRGLTA